MCPYLSCVGILESRNHLTEDSWNTKLPWTTQANTEILSRLHLRLATVCQPSSSTRDTDGLRRGDVGADGLGKLWLVLLPLLGRTALRDEGI
jgi:hypothetical protein